MRKNLGVVWLLTLTATCLSAADPTFIRRRISDIQPQPDRLTANARSAFYKPLFGAGDPQANQLKGIARYGELTVGPDGASATVSYPAEEQIYYILQGSGTLLYGDQKAPVKRDDFMYLPPGVSHGIASSSSGSVRLLVMGFRIPPGTSVAPTAKLMLANAADVPLVPVQGHGPTSLFKLLMGTTESTRDKLAAASQMVSLFIMDFAPGGTNIPHHHDMEEEIYFVLRGHGDMVAGGGADGNEGRYPAKEGDAYFIRLNCTVGFYSGSQAGESHDLILAVRSKYPFSRMGH
ncbi:MAG: cupin domain-containing protein [Acidobacteriia bacterium]|nr:cupin domain-containing protein [Terriglobia bacterium]